MRSYRGHVEGDSAVARERHLQHLGEGEREAESDREREREGGRGRERDTEGDRGRESETEAERGREGKMEGGMDGWMEGGRRRERERERSCPQWLQERPLQGLGVTVVARPPSERSCPAVIMRLLMRSCVTLKAERRATATGFSQSAGVSPSRPVGFRVQGSGFRV